MASSNSSSFVLNDFAISVIEGAKELSTRSEPIKVLESLIVVLIMVAGVIGNMLVLVAIIHTQRLRTATNYIIVGLSVSDINMALVVMPLTLTVLAAGRWPFGQDVCEAQGFCLFFFGYISIFLMDLTAINRYCCVNKPNLYRKLFKKNNTIAIVLLISGICAVLFSIIPALKLSTSFFLPGYAMCVMVITNPSLKVAHIVFDSVFLPLSLFTIGICYFNVFRRIRQHNINVAASTTGNQVQNAVSSEEIRVTKTLAAAMVGFTITWLPTLVITTISRANPLALPRQLQLLDTYLIFLSSSINPVIYGATNAAFRVEYKALMKSFLPRKLLSQNTVGIEMQEL